MDRRRDQALVAERLALAALVALFVIGAWSFRFYTNDDAFITFRYSRFLATGRGPYFNEGERVEGYTNPLLMVLMAAVFALGGEDAVPLAAKALGVASGAACVVLSHCLARQVMERDGSPVAVARSAGLLAAALVSASAGFALNSASGLETTLFAALLALGAWLTLRARHSASWPGAGLAFAGAYLTRPEGALVFGVHWLAHLLVRTKAEQDRRQFVRWLSADAAMVATALGGHLAFRMYSYDGEWLPNTFFAKQGGFARVPGWLYSYLGLHQSLLGRGGMLAALGGMIVGVRQRPPALPLAAAGLAGVAIPVWLGADWMPGWRFVVPYLPLLAPAVACGWASLLGRAPSVPALGWLAPAVVAALSLWLQSEERERLQADLRLRHRGFDTGHRTLARWLPLVTRPGDTIALMDIGLVGYLNPELRVLDLTGLTDRVIAKGPGSFLDKRFDPRLVLARRPRCIVLVLAGPGTSYQPPSRRPTLVFFSPAERALATDPVFESEYVTGRTRETGTHWLDALAAEIGAARVFEHGHPKIYYLLAAFLRREAAGGVVRARTAASSSSSASSGGTPTTAPTSAPARSPSRATAVRGSHAASRARAKD